MCKEKMISDVRKGRPVPLFSHCVSSCLLFSISVTVFSHVAYCSVLKVEAAGFFETLPAYQTTWCHEPEDCNLDK
jgi:hypothetical protein